MSFINKFVSIFVFILLATSIYADLNPYYYAKICPKALPTIKKVVEAAVAKEKRMGASLLRLHFHDCFVNGCDASILLDSAPGMESEKDAFPNKDSARGFEVIDKIKSEVDKVCCGSVVSCADILAVAARDSVVALGGQSWKVPLGRRDSKTADKNLANINLPGPQSTLKQLIKSFKNQGLNEQDLVALSGGHTIGLSQCINFKKHIYNDTNIDPSFASKRQSNCPEIGGDTNLAPLDSTPLKFDTEYFKELVEKKGLLHSDQVLFGNKASTSYIVKKYSYDKDLFYSDFGKSMVKMSEIDTLTGNEGEIRRNCRRVNSN